MSETLVQRVAAAGGLGFIGLYLVVAVLRIGHPFELEWMEGALVDHALRIVDGESLYVAPTLSWIPSLYPPFFFWCGAAATQVVGEGFFALRLVSLLASVGTLSLLWHLARRETGSQAAGILAAGAFAATFAAGGAWLDLARVDSLAIFLSLLSITLLRHGYRRPAMLAAGAIAAVACFTKQTSFLILTPVFGWALLTKPRAAIWASGAALLTGGASLCWLQWTSEGWFTYYALELPPSHAWVPEMWTGFWVNDVVATVPVLLLFALVGGLCPFWIAVLAGGLGASWLARLHEGGWDNVLLTGYAALSVPFAIGVHRLSKRLSKARPLLCGIVLWLCLGQFGWLAYDPRPLVPTHSDREAGASVVAELSGIDGDILVPNHGYLPRLAGKKTHAHFGCYTDVIRANIRETGSDLKQDAAAAMRRRAFAAVVLDSDPLAPAVFGQLFPGLLENYAPDRFLLPRDSRVLQPLTGAPCRPVVLYLPK